jgi:SPASM domain peptide maturase of grasp-with-spasm system
MPYLNVFSNCKLVKGNGMSLICDLQMRRYFHIPNDMAAVLDYLSKHHVEACYTEFGISNKSTINSYIQFMIKNDLGFLDDQIMPELVPLSMEWDAFSPITNVIIELDQALHYESGFIQQLTQLNLNALEIRCYTEITFEKLTSFLALFDASTLTSIKIILKWSVWCTESVLGKLVDQYLRVHQIMLHTAPNDQVFKFFGDTVSIIYSQAVLDSCLQCGNIQPAYFMTNVELFTESQQHNTCLNRKLSIDRNGYIKNCPSLSRNFGHMDDVQLDAVLADPAFKEHWFTKKDDIAVCRDCEFRYVCTDCRAYVEDPADPYAKPLKCGYDPYANVWEDWSTNPLKQQAIAYYGLETKALD